MNDVSIGCLDETTDRKWKYGQFMFAKVGVANDPLDKELEAHGHRFARYADDFIVLVKSANAHGDQAGATTEIRCDLNRESTPMDANLKNRISQNQEFHSKNSSFASIRG